MRQPNTAAEMVIIPVTGVANVGRGNFSTGAIHFALLRKALAHRTGLPVSQPVVPQGAGIIGSFDAICRGFARDVAEIDDRFGGARKLFVGHSLGGLLARNYVAKEQTADCLLTISTPNVASKCEGLKSLAIGWRWADINAFTDDIPHMSRASRVAQLACAHDGLIQPEIALQPISQTAALYMLADKAHHHQPPAGAKLYETLWPDNHISIITSLEGANVISHVASNLIANRDQVTNVAA